MKDLTRGERLQIMLMEEELAAVDNWRFDKRTPSRALRYANCSSAACMRKDLLSRKPAANLAILVSQGHRPIKPNATRSQRRTANSAFLLTCALRAAQFPVYDAPSFGAARRKGMPWRPEMAMRSNAQGDRNAQTEDEVFR